MNLTIVKIVHFGQNQAMEPLRFPTEDEVRAAARQGEYEGAGRRGHALEAVHDHGRSHQGHREVELRGEHQGHGKDGEREGGGDLRKKAKKKKKKKNKKQKKKKIKKKKTNKNKKNKIKLIY